MLIGFKVKNFRSFKELKHFSLLAGKVRRNENHVANIGKYKILKFSSIFGPNGSGKSNLIHAMEIVKVLFEKGANALINNLYYRGNGMNLKENSYFEYEIALDDKIFSYGFEINFFKNEIISEWLIDMTSAREIVIYERDTINKTSKSKFKGKNSLFTNCLEEMNGNNKELFLKEIIRRISIASNKDEFFDNIINVYKFLILDTVIIKPSTHRIFDINYFKEKEKIIRLLNALDINISEIIEEDSDLNYIRTKLPENVYLDIRNYIDEMYSEKHKVNCVLRIGNYLYTISKANNEYSVKGLKFKHKNSESTFGTYDESDGTIRILELIDILLSKNKLFLIDELDSSLHPLLVKGILEMFLKSNTNNQLIITTHEYRTLNFELVRRDEIWFTEKNADGNTKIYSLEEFKTDARFDKKIDKAYMEGRFGANPNININYEN